MEREGKIGSLLNLEASPLVSHKERLDKDSSSKSPTRTSFRGIVARFLTRRTSKGKEGVTSQSAGSQTSQSVPVSRVARSKAWQEKRKSVADLEKPMDGVGLATGNGDGDMSGVFIKDFAYALEELPVSRSSLCEECDEMRTEDSV